MTMNSDLSRLQDYLDMTGFNEPCILYLTSTCLLAKRFEERENFFLSQMRKRSSPEFGI